MLIPLKTCSYGRFLWNCQHCRNINLSFLNAFMPCSSLSKLLRTIWQRRQLLQSYFTTHVNLTTVHTVKPALKDTSIECHHTFHSITCGSKSYQIILCMLSLGGILTFTARFPQVFRVLLKTGSVIEFHFASAFVASWQKHCFQTSAKLVEL